MADSPSVAHLKATHYPSEVNVQRKEAYGNGLLVFFYVKTSPEHPLPNRETAHIAYFNSKRECVWDMPAA